MRYGFVFSLFLLFSTGALQAQKGGHAALMTAKFKVYGNCGMCEQRIEKAASIKGVKSADWDVDTKILSITFNGKKVTPAKVHKAVAAVGHDTDLVKADDKVYAKLHGCCQYDRVQ